MTAFGERVRELRVKNGVSIKYLAQSTGIHKSTIIRWERGKTVPRSVEIVSLLSKFFHVPSTYFLKDEYLGRSDIQSEICQLRKEVNALREQISRLSNPSRIPS